MAKLLFICLLFATVFSLSCKKDSPVPTPTSVLKAPVAKAGNDIAVLLPLDSATLDGSASYDPDSRAVEYAWVQLSGPSVAELLLPQTVKAKAKRLQRGLYFFELTVKNNVGLSSRDTVAVKIQLSTTIAANAGPDQVIDLATGRATLNGSASVDSLGLALNHQWRQIAGPTSQINSGNLAMATAVFSVANIYQFELKVWNANGEAYDTTQVTVKNCTVSRTEVPAQLTHLKEFSFSSYNAAKMLAVGNKLIIPVDVHDPIAVSAVFVYDVATGTYTEKELSFPRLMAATAVAGNKVFFAGGFTGFSSDFESTFVTDVVDIYDAASDTWSTAKLSQARGAIKAGVVGNKVVFAGGMKSHVLSSQVDIYDLQTNQWTTSQLAGESRAIERVVADGSNIYFLGGYTAWENPTGFGFGLTTVSKAIDIYNVASGTWSRNNMQVERYGFAAVLVDNKILIAGGVTGNYPNERMISNVEIITLPTMQRSNTCLPDATAWYSDEATAMKNGSAIFYLGAGDEKRKFNIYNPQTGAWSLGVHNFDVLGQHESVALASLNNQVYVLKGNSLFKLEY